MSSISNTIARSIKSIQSGTVTIAGAATSGTAVITAVNVAKSFITLTGLGSTGGSLIAIVSITGPTQVTMTGISPGAGNTFTQGFNIIEVY